MATKDLPFEILDEIFTKLPAKSIGKCRCLSKFWSTHLSTTQIIQKHLLTRQKALHKHENIIFVKKNPPQCFVTITSPMMKHEVSSDLPIYAKDYLYTEWASVIDSCNGLVLLSTKERDEMLLINPVTLQQVKIARCFLDYQSESTCLERTIGFGYDHVNDDYKIVFISFCDNDDEYSDLDTFIHVYSVKKGAWKPVETKSSVQIVINAKPGVFVNGSVHWSTGLRWTSSSEAHVVIAAFDLVNESFHDIPFPGEFKNLPLERKKLFNLGGCLCTASKFSTDMVDLWMMKEYGVAESWCSFRICSNGLGNGVRSLHTRNGFELLCFVGDDKILGVDTEGRWSCFELNEGTVKEVTIGGVEASFLEGVHFVDSLVSPEQRVVATQAHEKKYYNANCETQVSQHEATDNVEAAEDSGGPQKQA